MPFSGFFFLIICDSAEATPFAKREFRDHRLIDSHILGKSVNCLPAVLSVFTDRWG